jgi:hypothetical protein
MCLECGALIGCTAVSHDASRPFHGCQDNGILTAEILRLTRERKNLISSLEQIVNFDVSVSVEWDYRIGESIRDMKQLARNTLRDYDEDSCE